MAAPEMTSGQERACLQLNPFEGDRDVIYRVLRDGFVRSRVKDECDTCLGPVVPGVRVRARVEVYEGKVYTFRFCGECCAAMAKSWDDGGEAWLERHAVAERKIAARSPGGRDTTTEPP